MPPGLGGSLSDQVYLNLVAYILDGNGAHPGDAPLTADAAVMIGDAADVAAARRAARDGETPRRRPARFVNREVEQRLTPVTDALLQDPPPGDWLSWRRTRNSHGYSPLDQVTRDNVDELQLAWVLAIREGNNQTTPLVHDGVMFLASPGNVVQAIDALTGDVIWEYRSPLPEDAPQRGATRTLAFYGYKVYLATHDAALVALDARTGTEVWRTVKADYKAGLQPARRTSHRQRCRCERHQRVSALQGTDLFHHRARPGHRRGVVAYVDDCAAGRSEQRVVG